MAIYSKNYREYANKTVVKMPDFLKHIVGCAHTVLKVSTDLFF
jgi:hypothetical protein